MARKRTHVRKYTRRRHGKSDHGGEVRDHERGYEGAEGVKVATMAANPKEKWLADFRKDRLSEREVLLLKRRLNHGQIVHDDIPFPEGGYKLSLEQTEKGLDWLMNEWKTPMGRVRKNNPFGFRETDILEDFTEFRLVGFYNTATSFQREQGFNYYQPIYKVLGFGGKMSFQYYVDYEGIHIIG
jgi:hypothetical protein